jgi:hypothetical protein
MPELQERSKHFIEELIEVYKKYGLSLNHEDSHGAFIIEELSSNNIQHLRNVTYEDQNIVRSKQ